ncbi:MAG: BamA/TamA family outer membrane protein, partial [Gammaproteobacteria bacterium]|nr:BamA/TamA family outer membrane protein [Gammaproteobacteria bacterium]
WDNILGTNQSLRLKVREYGETLGVNDIRQSLTYRIPRINGSPYTVDLFTNYRDAAVEFDAADPQLREEIKYGFNVQRWRHLKSRSSGWYLGAGLYTKERSNEALYTGDSSRPDYQGDFLELRFGYKKINQYLFNRRGKDFGYILDTTQILFNAEENYTKHLLFYRSYYRLNAYPLNNLNVQLQLGVSDGDYLGDTVFSLGGKTLRGYEKDSYSGNAMVLMNLEYLIPFSTDPAYRYGVLFDLGNTYDSTKDIDLADLHAAIGVGFRWKLAAFVKVNIRLDIGYAIDTGSSNILLNSRHLF